MNKEGDKDQKKEEYGDRTNDGDKDWENKVDKYRKKEEYDDWTKEGDEYRKRRMKAIVRRSTTEIEREVG